MKKPATCHTAGLKETGIENIGTLSLSKNHSFVTPDLFQGLITH